MSGVVADESGGPVEGGVGFVEEGGEGLEDVRDAEGLSTQDAAEIAGISQAASKPDCTRHGCARGAYRESRPDGAVRGSE